MEESPERKMSYGRFALLFLRHMGMSLATIIALSILLIWHWLSPSAEEVWPLIGLVIGLRAIYSFVGFVRWLVEPRVKSPDPGPDDPSPRKPFRRTPMDDDSLVEIYIALNSHQAHFLRNIQSRLTVLFSRSSISASPKASRRSDEPPLRTNLLVDPIGGTEEFLPEILVPV
jgi:hypothetical protein